MRESAQHRALRLRGLPELRHYRENVEPRDPPTCRAAPQSDIGVPLGRVVEMLREDADGVGWWGTLGHELAR
jgi:hypothetical protein